MATCIPLNDYVKDKAKQFNTDAETIQDALYTYYNELGLSDNHYPSDLYLKSYVDYQVVYEDGAELAEEFRKKFYAEPRIYGDGDELAYAIHTAKKYFNADLIKIETLADDRKMLSIVEATSDKSSAITKGLQEQRELTLTIDGKSITIPYIYCKEETDLIIRNTGLNVVFKPNRKTSDLFKKAQKKYPELFKILELDGITVEYLSNTIDSYILLEQFTALQQFLDYDHSNESRAAAMRDAVTYIAKSNKKALPVLTPIAKAKKQWQEVADWNKQHMTFDRNSHKYTVDGKTNKYSVSELASILLYGEKSEANGNMVASGTVGTTVDDLLRALLDNTFREEDYTHLSPDLINQAKQIARDIRKELNNTFKNGYHIITDEAALMTCGYVNDPFTGEKVLIAGTMDMVVIDNKGVSHLYDFKTHKSNYDKEIKDTDKYKTLTQYALLTYFYKTMNNVNSVNNITDNKLLQVNYTLQVPAELKSLTDITGSVYGDKIVFTYKNISDKTITQTINIPTDLKFYKTVEGLPSFEYEVQPITNSIKSQYILASINPSLVSVRRTKATTTQDDVHHIITTSSGGYAQRTKENAEKADITIAIARDFTTGGEKKTKSVAGSKYLAVKLNTTDNPINSGIISGKRTAARLKQKGDYSKGIKLNIAGNGIYILASEDISLDDVDQYMVGFITGLQQEGIKIDEIRSGGLTGIDEAGIKAGIFLNIPTIVHAPKGYKFRDITGKDISDKKQFESRFNIPDKLRERITNLLNQQQSESATAQETSTEEYTQEMRDIKADAIANGTFMKAPNGQPTNLLNEKQWLQVRTKAFKEWFGDWEKYAKLNNATVIWGHPASGKTYLFKQGREDIIDFDSEYKVRINKIMGLPEGADAKELRKAARNARKQEYHDLIMKLFDEAKTEAKRTGKKLLVSDMMLLKEREADIDVITNMSDEKFIERSAMRGETDAANKMLWKNDINDAMGKVSNKSKIINTEEFILDDLYGTNVSKVVDENGEPLVVWHGGSMVNVFDTTGKHKSAGIKKGEKGAYFTTSKSSAQNYESIHDYKYGDAVFEILEQLKESGLTDEEIEKEWNSESMQGLRSGTRAFFLNIRNPKHTEYTGERKKGYVQRDSNIGNNDGQIIKVEDSKEVEYVAVKPNQIKSATDNSGRFSTTNNDVYDTITVLSLQKEASKEDTNVVPLPYIVEKSNINSRNSNYNGEYIIRVDKEAMQRFNEHVKDMRNAEKKAYIKLRMQHILVTLPIGCKIRVLDVENVDDLNMLRNFLKSDGIIADYSDIQEIDLTDEKDLLEQAKKLGLLTEVTNLSTADEPIYSNILRVPSFTYGKTAETIERSKSKEELINTVGARKVRTLASSAMFALSDLVTQIQEGDARLVDYIENEFFQIGDKSPEEILDIVDELKGKDRLEIIQTITLDNLEDAIKRMYFTIDDEYGLDEDFIEETEVIHDNWKAFLEYGRVTLAELEQLPIDGNGLVVNQMELVLFGEEDEQTIQSRYGSSLEQWQVGFRSVSTFMSMGLLVKQALGTMKVLDEDNDVVANAWGIAERLDAGVITGKILSWVKECSTAEEMVKVLQQKVADPNNADERWLLQLVNDDPELTNSDGELVGIGRLITEDLQGNRHSDNENFRSQFFTTMRKYFLKYGIVFQKGKTTNIKMLNESEGIDPLLDEILAKIRTGNIPLFENGKLVEDTILNLSKLIGEVDASTNIQNKVALKVLDILDTIGIDHFDIEHAKLMLLNPKLRGAFIKLANYLVSKIQEVFEKAEETQRKGKTINLQDAVAEKTRSDIKKILNIFHDFIKMGYEAVFYLDGKLYYSYVMPSYISRFNQDIRNKDDFMKDTFSEVDFFATKIGNKTVYLNKWIERLATDKNVRLNVFDHKVQLSDRGKNYRKKTAAEYSSSMLREFYYDVNNIFAWYRIPMMSNKPSEEYIKFYRVKNNFRKTISEWLVDTTFQEVLRISDVVTRAVSRLNGTMLEEECTENYDLDLADFAKKDKDGNPIIIDGKIQIADDKKYLLEEENIVTLKLELLKLGANGAKFVMLDFLEDYLLDYLDGVDNTVGKYLHDKILAEDKKFDGTSEAEQIDELRNTIIREIEAQIDENGEIARDDNGNVLRSSDSKFQEYINFLQSEGYIKVDDKGKWSTRDSDILGKDNETIKERLAEFFWNDLYASISIMLLYIGDPAYYKNAEDLQKRLAQLHAPGSALNTTARDSNGELYSKDGIYRGITLQDEEIISDTIDNLNKVYDELMEQNENNPAMRAYLTTQKNNIIKALSEVNATDAQTFCTPTGMRKRLGMLGQWGNDREEAYEKILKGEITQSNLNILMQPTKPFIYTQINKPSYHGTMNTRRFGVLIKTSEYMLIIADAIIKGAGRTNTKLAAVFDAIEESMGTWNKDKTKFTPNGRGIDAISFNSSIKTGLGAVIDLNGNITYQEIKERLKNAIYAEENNVNNPSADDILYNSNYVYELNYSDYNIQQAVPTHFFDKQQIGSQTKALGFADVDEYVRDSAGNIMLDEDGNKIEATIRVKNSDGELETITVSEAKKEFYLKLANNIEISKQRLIKEFKLTNVDKRIQNIAISELLQKQMLRDSRFGADLLWAVDTDDNGEFNIPLSDPTHSERIQQLLYSIIKSRIYKLEIHGGPVVQVANWGTGEDLHIRFTNKDGDTILTEEEFNVRKEEFKEKGHARNIVYPFDHASIVDENGELFSNYKQYKEYHKGGGVYYECYAPIFDEGLLKLYEKNGVIDINKIRAELPELLELIGYRIPTEAKYSMASLRIVGFLPREAGEGLMLPKEWTAISGSDYDIDKLYIMRRSYEFQEAPESIQSDKYKGTFVKGNTKIDRNNDRIFDILQGVLEAHLNITKVLKNGNFDTLKEEAYKIEAYKASDKSLEELDKMSSKKLKNLAMLDKNLIYNHIHTLFFKQNMVAADLIGVFALSNVSHAYLSMHAIHVGMDKGLPLRGVEFNSFSLFGNVITNDTLHIDAPFGFDGTPISDNIALFLAASVDAVKDPILNLVNINMLTVNIAMAMARMGFSIKQICLFLGLDVVKDIITDMNSTKEYLDDALLKKKIELQANVNKIANGNIRINNDISEENLRDNIKNRSALTDLAIVLILSEISKIADTFRPIINMTRFNSISASKGPSIIESFIDDLKVFDFNNRIAKNNPEIAEAVNNPMLKQLRESLNSLELQLMESRFVLYGSEFRRHFLFWLANMEYDIYTIPKKEIKNFGRFYMDFAVNSVSPLFNFDRDNRLKVVSTYPAKIAKLKKTKGLRQNKFIQNLTARFDYKDQYLSIDVDVRGKGDSYVEQIREDFTEFAKKHPKYTANIIEYMFNRGGFGYSPKTFTNLITNYIKTNLMSEYISNLRELENGASVFNTLVCQFILNTVPVKKMPKVSYVDYSIEGTTKSFIEMNVGDTFTLVDEDPLNEDSINGYGVYMLDLDGNSRIVLVLDIIGTNRADKLVLQIVEPLGGNGLGIELDPNNTFVKSIYRKTEESSDEESVENDENELPDGDSKVSGEEKQLDEVDNLNSRISTDKYSPKTMTKVTTVSKFCGVSINEIVDKLENLNYCGTL